MRAIASLVVLLLLPAAALADDVHLNNGGVFEDVLAAWEGDQLRVRMPSGELRLPRSSVARVVEKSGGEAEYLRRAEALRRGRAGAADWLELARWARAEGLPRAAREAALEAAEREPRLAGLAPLLEGYGMVLHTEAGRWITYEESMRRQGFVRYEGQWISRVEHAELERAAAEAAAAARADRMERAAAETRLAAARLELERQQLMTAQALTPGYYDPSDHDYSDYYYPGYFYYPPLVWAPGFGLPGLRKHPGLIIAIRPHHPGHGGMHRPPGAVHHGARGLALDVTIRQPGSLFPARVGRGSK